MDNVPSQDSKEINYPYRNTYATKVKPNNSALSNSDLKFESDSPILDETIEIVKDKVWSFRSALRAAAEALVNFGLPPQVVGYEYPHLPVSCSEYAYCIVSTTLVIVKETSVRSQLKHSADLNLELRSVPLGEDDKLAKKNEGEAALQKVAEDEMNSRSASYGSQSKVSGRGEGSGLVRRPDDEDDTDHAFAEAVRKEKEERKSLTRTYKFDEDEDDGKGS